MRCCAGIGLRSTLWYVEITPSSRVLIQGAMAGADRKPAPQPRRSRGLKGPAGPAHSGLDSKGRRHLAGSNEPCTLWLLFWVSLLAPKMARVLRPSSDAERVIQKRSECAD